MSRLSEVGPDRRRRRFLRSTVVCAVVVTGVALVAVGSAPVPNALGRGAASSSPLLAPVFSAIPGASATLEPGGSIIDATVPASTGVPPDPAGRTTADPSNLYEIAAADISWRVAVATDLISTRNADVLGYSFRGLAAPPPGTDQLALKAAANFSHGMVRDAPDLAFSLDIPSLGKVTLEQAEAQATSNVAEFERIATGVDVEGVAVTPVWLDRDSNVFALRIQLHVADADTLRRYLGDLISGPATGLVGDEKTLIGGLAINVTDDAGRSSGWWTTAHGSIGIGILGPALIGTAPGSTHGTYRNLTGGPGTSGSSPGYTPAHRSEETSRGTPTAKTKSRSTKTTSRGVSPSSSRHEQPTDPHGDQEPTTQRDVHHSNRP